MVKLIITMDDTKPEGEKISLESERNNVNRMENVFLDMILSDLQKAVRSNSIFKETYENN